MAELITVCPLADSDYAGHCPACHKPVLYSEEGDSGPVWTCPANLSEGNPHHVEQPSWATEELFEEAGCYSNCAEDFGGTCDYDDMPLHSACYGADNITW